MQKRTSLRGENSPEAIHYTQKKGGRLVFHFVQAPTVRLDHSHASMTAILAFFSCPPDCSPGSHCHPRLVPGSPISVATIAGSSITPTPRGSAPNTPDSLAKGLTCDSATLNTLVIPLRGLTMRFSYARASSRAVKPFTSLRAHSTSSG